MTEWSKRKITGLNDDQASEVLDQLAELMTEEATTYIDWTHSEENQGH